MRFIFFIISLLLLLPSCRKGGVPSSTDTDEDVVDKKPIEVRLSNNLLVSVENQSFGRGPIYGEQMPEDYIVGVYGILTNASDIESSTINKAAQTNLVNAKYSVESNGDLRQTGFAEYPVDYDGLTFYAYYPYTETRNLIREGDNKYMSFTFPIDDMSSAVDFLYIDKLYKETPTGASSNVANLKFRHALSMLRLNFYGTTSNVNVSSVTLGIKANPSGKFYINNGECKPKDTNSNEYYFIESADLKDGNFTLELLMYPDVVVEYISCLINDSPVVIYDDATVSEENRIKLVKGEFVTMNLSYVPKNANFTNSMENWQSTGNELDFEFQDPNAVTQN